MLFNSIEFMIFLSIVFLCYWLIRDFRWQNVFVVVASYFFYAWWNWKFLFLIAMVTLSSYVAAIAIGKWRSKGILVAEIALCLGVLGVFKYYNFFVENAASLLNVIGFNAHAATLNVILPVGISFYTFQALGYVIDTFRGGACRLARFGGLHGVYKLLSAAGGRTDRACR